MLLVCSGRYVRCGMIDIQCQERCSARGTGRCAGWAQVLCRRTPYPVWPVPYPVPGHVPGRCSVTYCCIPGVDNRGGEERRRRVWWLELNEPTVSKRWWW